MAKVLLIKNKVFGDDDGGPSLVTIREDAHDRRRER